MEIRRRFKTDNYAQPRHILEAIVWHKEQEIAQMKEQMTLNELQQQIKPVSQTRIFRLALQQSVKQPSLIAEVKKASPSRGMICPNFHPVDIALAYQRGGAACLSVLTDSRFFQGSFDYLRQIREATFLPLLCKEFIIDPYQIYLARINGANAVLLIAAILSDQDLQQLLYLTHQLGMDALVEVHTLAELDRVLALSGVRLIGINNRNLENFTVTLETTEQLMAQRRNQLDELGITVISESGIHTHADLERVAKAGADGVLVGESLVKQADWENAVSKLYQPLTSAVR